MSSVRSIVALVAVVAVSATYLVVRDWIGYAAAEDLDPAVIPAGSAAEDGGVTWGPLELDDVTFLRDPDGDPIPADARVLVASFTVRPGADPVSCRIVSLSDADGRSWADGGFWSLPDSYDDALFPCSDPISSVTQVRAVFVVPGDAEAPFRLTMSTRPVDDGPEPLVLLDAN